MRDRSKPPMVNLKRQITVFLLVVFMLLSSCFSSPTTRFYLLSPLPEEDRTPTPERSPAIGVGPVRFRQSAQGAVMTYQFPATWADISVPDVP